MRWPETHEFHFIVQYPATGASLMHPAHMVSLKRLPDLGPQRSTVPGVFAFFCTLGIKMHVLGLAGHLFLPSA